MLLNIGELNGFGCKNVYEFKILGVRYFTRLHSICKKEKKQQRVYDLIHTKQSAHFHHTLGGSQPSL